MTKYKIVYNPKACIGAGECAAVSKMWHINTKGKAELKGSVLNKDGSYELEIDEKDLTEQQKAAGSCPVGAIKLIKC